MEKVRESVIRDRDNEKRVYDVVCKRICNLCVLVFGPNLDNSGYCPIYYSNIENMFTFKSVYIHSVGLELSERCSKERVLDRFICTHCILYTNASRQTEKVK